ncbi:MAG: T9SS type A sorting domain-containing protein [Bacteroidota bacterium]
MMRAIIPLVGAMIIAFYPNKAFSQASINSGNNISEYDIIRSWTNYNVQLPATYYSMNNFVVDQEYKIVVVQDDPAIVQNLQMYLAEDYPLDGIIVYTPLGSEVVFSYHANYGFRLQYDIPSTAPIGQTQLLKFQIYRKRLAFWDWQTSFYVYVNTTCPGNITLGGLLGALDYEVGGELTVPTAASPNGGLTELDAGQAVILSPGFESYLSNGGAIQAIIDGCGGAYRPAGTSDNGTITSLSNNSGALKNVDLVVYPIPVSDKCKIHIPHEAQGKELKIEIMDLNGRILYSQHKVYDQDTEADMSGFESGLYFINISGENINYNKKIIKE